MELEECERCGEEYPEVWGYCPVCDSGERIIFKMRNDSSDY